MTQVIDVVLLIIGVALLMFAFTPWRSIKLSSNDMHVLSSTSGVYQSHGMVPRKDRKGVVGTRSYHIPSTTE